MFNKKKQPAIRSLISDGTQINGPIVFTDGLRVDGTVVGTIQGSEERSSILVISETASVTGEVFADHVIINGTVKGPVHARLMLELQPRAKIEGDIYYTALEMHQGAIIDGRLHPITVDLEVKPTLKLAANN